MTENCRACRFFQVTDGEIGDCRKYPPHVDHIGTAWPVVADNDWCGEFKPQGQPATPQVKPLEPDP